MGYVGIEHYRFWGADLAIDLVNTAPETCGYELLSTPDDVTALIRRYDPALDARADAVDLERTAWVRERLLDVVADPDPALVAPTLNYLASEAHAAPRMTDHDGHTWHIDHHVAGDRVWRHLAAEAAFGLMDFMTARGAERIRRCAARDCHRYFTDTTKNASSRFCPARGCANRERVRRHRERLQTR
ncbi:CGNR zinc finger domain-containing protein [Gordonia jinhuaensis]|uniref:Zinc finger CGNR domain-containing protein n=1 Tax=Gordonia jinhuaensis TaxID=1517702 RepID=A0A916SW63_9ACTN|nr:CGNR zinc finger domain-containing protein [Gordonia jinhuaensis]GGB16996.1 hypothetical protein GCM10011489_01370 [Gordonia jinhuaensis]